MSNNEIRKLKPDDAQRLFDSPNLAFTAKNNIEAILFLREKAIAIENNVKS